LVISPETASDLQRAGTYGVTLTVTIGVSWYEKKVICIITLFFIS
jgi:hypothetical protein